MIRPPASTAAGDSTPELEQTRLQDISRGQRGRQRLALTGISAIMRMLDSMITAMAGRGRPWFATHAQIADLAGTPPIDPP